MTDHFFIATAEEARAHAARAMTHAHHDETRRLIACWRVARRGVGNADLVAHRAVYERMERDYAMLIRRRLGRCT